MISSIPIKVCHVANSDISGGAARAAYRIHNALNSNQKNRIMSSMRVLKNLVMIIKLKEDQRLTIN